MRSKYVIGNWKMNKSLLEIKDFFKSFDASNSNVIQGVCPQSIHLLPAFEASKNTNIIIGAQDCSHETNGAFTGQTSAEGLKELGVSFTLIGHSERRQYQNESDELLNQKLHTALKQKLKVVFCIGETLQEREQEQTNEILEKQLMAGLKGFENSLKDDLIIAYEPVWAIGTGKTASPEQAASAHKFIRSVINTLGLSGEAIPILYGGSVKPSNFNDLLVHPDIDGGLVGGASLKPADFSSLVDIAQRC